MIQIPLLRSPQFREQFPQFLSLHSPLFHGHVFRSRLRPSAEFFSRFLRYHKRVAPLENSRAVFAGNCRMRVPIDQERKRQLVFESVPLNLFHSQFLHFLILRHDRLRFRPRRGDHVARRLENGLQKFLMPRGRFAPRAPRVSAEFRLRKRFVYLEASAFSVPLVRNRINHDHLHSRLFACGDRLDVSLRGKRRGHCQRVVSTDIAVQIRTPVFRVDYHYLLPPARHSPCQQKRAVRFSRSARTVDSHLELGLHSLRLFDLEHMFDSLIL